MKRRGSRNALQYEIVCVTCVWLFEKYINAHRIRGNHIEWRWKDMFIIIINNVVSHQWCKLKLNLHKMCSEEVKENTISKWFKITKIITRFSKHPEGGTLIGDHQNEADGNHRELRYSRRDRAAQASQTFSHYKSVNTDGTFLSVLCSTVQSEPEPL